MVGSGNSYKEVRFQYYIILIFLNIMSSSYGARILGIFPVPSISHQLQFQAIMKTLAARGHQVTVISTDPLKVPSLSL
ncbi:Ecdysteroid UDP-glucosyltransferase [Blattella germanica]|nr:Ecdysteroid UDP-glucosyltransferase [Blattella germanica]